MERPWRFQKIEGPRFLNKWHIKVVRVSALLTVRLYPPGNKPGNHFCYRLSRPQGHCAAGRMSTKSLSDNRRTEWTIIAPSPSQIQNEYFQNTVRLFSLFHLVFPKPQNFCVKRVLSAEGISCTHRSTCWIVNLLVCLLQQFKFYIHCKALRNPKYLLL